MLDFAAIIGFDWDDGNTAKSVDKHAVDPAEAEQVFFLDPLVTEDVKHSVEEPRFHALGETFAGRLLHITFTLRHQGTMIRVISARDMNRKERAHYAQST